MPVFHFRPQLVRLTDLTLAVKNAQADASMCVTFEVANDTGKWVQYGDGLVNAAYPLCVQPMALLQELGGALDDWRPRKYLTVELSSTNARPIARWIETYFERVLQAKSGLNCVCGLPASNGRVRCRTDI